MKKIIYLLTFVFTLISCSSNTDFNAVGEDLVTDSVVSVSFNATGFDVSMTRATFQEADLSTIFIVDEKDGEITDVVRLSQNDELETKLSFGSHRLYLVATSSTLPALDVETKTLLTETPIETYLWSEYINVTNETKSIDAPMTKVNYKISFMLTDKIPIEAERAIITFENYRSSLNIETVTSLSGNPHSFIFNVAGYMYDIDGGATFEVCGFAPSQEETTTECSISFLDSQQNEIVKHNLTIPIQSGYHTKVKGKYFATGIEFSPDINIDYLGEKEVNI